jgi:hypothetical protein
MLLQLTDQKVIRMKNVVISGKKPFRKTTLQVADRFYCPYPNTRISESYRYKAQFRVRVV